MYVSLLKTLLEKHGVLMLLKTRPRCLRQTKTRSGHQPYTLDKANDEPVMNYFK